jgi:hypothetical protein
MSTSLVLKWRLLAVAIKIVVALEFPAALYVPLYISMHVCTDKVLFLEYEITVKVSSDVVLLVKK